MIKNIFTLFGKEKRRKNKDCETQRNASSRYPENISTCPVGKIYNIVSGRFYSIKKLTFRKYLRILQ